MKNQCNNIYKISREGAGQCFTQDYAAEQLHVSTRSMSDYETGRTIPPEDVVCRMVEVYQDPILTYLHLQTNTEVGRHWLPKIQREDLPCAVLKFQKEKKDVHSHEDQMVSIACDGEISEDEVPVWRQVVTEIEHIAAAAMSLLFIPERERRPLQAAR